MVSLDPLSGDRRSSIRTHAFVFCAQFDVDFLSTESDLVKFPSICYIRSPNVLAFIRLNKVILCRSPVRAITAAPDLSARG